MESRRAQWRRSLFGIDQSNCSQTWRFFCVFCNAVFCLRFRVGEDHQKGSKKSKNADEEPAPAAPDSNLDPIVGMVESTRRLYRPETDWNEGFNLWWQQLKAMVVKRVHMNTRRLSLVFLQLLMPASLVIVCQLLQDKIPGNFQPKERLVSLDVISFIFLDSKTSVYVFP